MNFMLFLKDLHVGRNKEQLRKEGNCQVCFVYSANTNLNRNSNVSLWLLEHI